MNLPPDLDPLPHGVTLVAVSKQQPDAKIQRALDTGHRCFGENRVQEAQKHWAHRRAHYPDLKLHLIGPLQSNKVAEAVTLFDVIHTVDREKIARALRVEMTHRHKNIPCFIQVNIGAEPQKSGIALNALSDFYSLCVHELKLDIIGLMGIPPVGEVATPYFTKLAELARDLNLKCLSMGMSDDYKDAMACGATHVRIGSAFFGSRD